MEEKIKNIQGEIAKGNNLESATQEEEEYRKKWKDIILREEFFWKQRSRVCWLTEGDKNITFFHRSAFYRKRRNTINRLEGEGGRVFKDQEEMGRHVVEYYSKVYIKDNKVGN